MSIYHEIVGTRRYEYRYWFPSLIEGGKRQSLTGWQDGGSATPETLNKIVSALSDSEYEVRQACNLSDETGRFVGTLTFAALVTKGTIP